MKTSNVIVGIVLAGAAVLVGKYIYKNFRSEKKKLAEEKETAKAELESIGLDVEKYEEEIDETLDENNLVKKLYHGIRFNPNWNLEVVEGSVEEPIHYCENPIYIMQSKYGVDNFLDIHFEIPKIIENIPEEISNGRGGSRQKKMTNLNPQISDFISSINDKVNQITEELKFVDYPYKELVATAILSYISQDEEGNQYEEQIALEIAPKLYEGWAEDPKRSLTAFVQDWKNDEPSAISRMNEKLAEFETSAGIQDAVVEDLILTYKVKFKIADLNVIGKSDNFGLDLRMGLQALRMITDDLKIYSRYHEGDTESIAESKIRASKILRYNRIIFCAPDSNGNWWMNLNYVTDRLGHIKVSHLDYV